MRNISALLCTLLLAACSSHAPVSNRNVNLVVEQSHTLVKPGESVTFTAHATGVTGRDEEIRWEARGGDLDDVNDSERYARVEYDRPGVYQVLAKLYVDGRLIETEKATVQVEPLS